MADGVLAGRFGTAQVRLVGHLLAPRARDGLAEAEGFLATQAVERTFREHEQVVAYLAQHLDPDGCEASAKERRARRDVWLVPTLDGSCAGKLDLDPIAGAIVAGELERLATLLHEADVAEAKARLGREPGRLELSRTPAQRRADALVEMARRSRATGGEARPPAPLVSVLVDFPTLSGRICELANGVVVTPGSLLAHLDTALIERAVWKSPTRVEVGHKSRLFTGATRRAVELRDRVFQHPHCEVPLAACQVDHIVPASQGGPTTQENGRLVCPAHNRLRNTVPELPEVPRPPGEVPPSRRPGAPPDPRAPDDRGAVRPPGRRATSAEDDEGPPLRSTGRGRRAVAGRDGGDADRPTRADRPYLTLSSLR